MKANTKRRGASPASGAIKKRKTGGGTRGQKRQRFEVYKEETDTWEILSWSRKPFKRAKIPFEHECTDQHYIDFIEEMEKENTRVRKLEEPSSIVSIISTPVVDSGRAIRAKNRAIQSQK